MGHEHPDVLTTLNDLVSSAGVFRVFEEKRELFVGGGRLKEAKYKPSVALHCALVVLASLRCSRPSSQKILILISFESCRYSRSELLQKGVCEYNALAIQAY